MVDNKLNSIFVGVVESLEHEEISIYQIRFVGFLLKILMHVLQDKGYELYMI
jgi:hypothetical protein